MKVSEKQCNLTAEGLTVVIVKRAAATKICTSFMVSSNLVLRKGGSLHPDCRDDREELKSRGPAQGANVVAKACAKQARVPLQAVGNGRASATVGHSPLTIVKPRPNHRPPRGMKWDGEQGCFVQKGSSKRKPTEPLAEGSGNGPTPIAQPARRTRARSDHA